jgi:hypothetical protein
MGSLALSLGNHERAARLFGAEEGARAAADAPLPSAYRAEHDRNVAAVRAELGEEAFAAVWRRERR